ncbi:MAG: HAD-IA family hydrolase, partial [Bacillota bacterium]|nr:HAD-IA family hydrolase [Bacillota bacterium]
MRPKGIIFDFDGTLADTLPICVLSFKQAFKKTLGVEYSDAEILKHFGKSEEGIIKNLVAPEDYEECLDAYIKTYEANHYLCPKPFDGITDILDTIKATGIGLGLITGKGKHTIKIALDYLDLSKYFEYVEHGDPQKSIKTQCIKKIADNWNLKSNETAYVGDQVTDIADTNQAGALAIAVSWATTSNYALLKQHNPDLLFKTTDEFKNWILDIGK